MDGSSQNASGPPAPTTVVGRTPYDALAELFGLLGRALPWVTILALFLYTFIEIGKAYQAAQSAATLEFAQRVEALNKLLQSNFAEIEKLRVSQLDGLAKFSGVNSAMMKSIAENQDVLAAARDQIASARQKQDEAAVKEQISKRELQDSKREQQELITKIAGFERQVWAAESLIDSANRLTRFIASRNNGDEQTVSLDRNSLSRQFENSQVDAIVRGGDGTLFYGLYRIPGNQIASFLMHLSVRFPLLARRLDDAGGGAAALAGKDEFKYEWTSISRNRDFIVAQDVYIDETNYQPFINRLTQSLADGATPSNFDPTKRSKALQAVLWSVAVQHGPNTKLPVRAWDGQDISTASDEALIRAIYKERRLIDRYFPSENEASRTLLTARYILEEELALKMLSRESRTPGVR